MKCMSCQAEIPPAWVHAINCNVCPGCGGSIMDESSQHLLGELREAMNQMANSPEGLAGWLLSNYKLVKVAGGEPTHFHQKPLLDGAAEPPAPAPRVATAERGPAPQPAQGTQLVNKFLKRTDVRIPDQESLAKKVRELKSGGGSPLLMDETDMDSDDEYAVEGNDFDEHSYYPAVSDANPFQQQEAKRQKAKAAILSGRGGFTRGS